MAQTIKVTSSDLVAAARAQINELAPTEAMKLANNPDVVLVDLRDPRERERDGAISGAFHCPRGMLEFWIDPTSPYHKPIFAQDKKFVFFCAGGLRSALAAKQAQDMGLTPVAHIVDGFAGWKRDGGLIEPLPAKAAPR